MARSKTYRVIDNRFQFKCEICGAKRSLAIPPETRSKTVKCHKCGTVSRCALNRRGLRREHQSGKAMMTLPGGRQFPVDLRDISFAGVGVDVAPGSGRMLNVRWEVKLECNWNSNLFSRGRYVIKNIQGDRIGIQNVSFRRFQ